MNKKIRLWYLPQIATGVKQHCRTFIPMRGVKVGWHHTESPRYRESCYHFLGVDIHYSRSPFRSFFLICFGTQHPQPASIAQVHHFDIVAQGYEGREIVSQESIIPQGFGPFLSELSSYLTMPNGSAGGLAATTALSTPLYLDAASLDTWLCSGFTSVDSNDHYNKCTSHRNHALRNWQTRFGSELPITKDKDCRHNLKS